MTLSQDDVMKAARIAADAFRFSIDPAVDRDDFIAAAALRILERNPTTIGAAVFCGREGISRIVGQVRFKKNAESVSMSAAGANGEMAGAITDGQQLRRGGISVAEKKRRRFARELIKQVGRPIWRFGKYGVAYPIETDSDLESVWFERSFDSLRPLPLPEQARRWRLKVYGSQTPHVTALADSHFVLLLVDVDDGKKEKTNAACVAGCRCKKAIRKAG